LAPGSKNVFEKGHAHRLRSVADAAMVMRASMMLGGIGLLAGLARRSSKRVIHGSN
jgi:hypothetical protein